MRGEIDCTVRIWRRLHVKVGGRYRLGASRRKVVPVFGKSDATNQRTKASDADFASEALGPGFVEVTSIRPIELADITPALARRSGFNGVVDLLKTAKHGPGENVWLIEFVWREE